MRGCSSAAYNWCEELILFVLDYLPRLRHTPPVRRSRFPQPSPRAWIRGARSRSDDMETGSTAHLVVLSSTGGETVLELDPAID